MVSVVGARTKGHKMEEGTDTVPLSDVESEGMDGESENPVPDTSARKKGDSDSSQVSGGQEAYRRWASFWKKLKKSKNIGSPMYLEYFSDAAVQFHFYKLGCNPTEHLPGALAKVCNKLPLLKRRFKAKWQLRYGCIKDGLLVYFLNDQPKSIALGCISLPGSKFVGEVRENSETKAGPRVHYFTLNSRHPRRPKKKIYAWQLGAESLEECESLKREIEKHA